MIVTNVTDGRKTFTLPHDAYCLSRGRCACVVCLPFGRKRPAVLSIEEGQEITVSRAVLSVPEIASAVRRGRLRIGGR